MPNRCAGCGAPLNHGALGGLCALCALSDALAFKPTIEPPPCLPFDTIPGSSPPPEILGGYQLTGLIARGGMGTVFLARSCSDDTQVAIKLLHGGVYAQDEFKARFRLEADAIATLNHPSIVRLVQTGEHRGQFFYAMEYVPGPNLRQVTGGAPMSPGKAARWLLDITEGIAHAHERGILHRDLKPSNILIGPDNHPRITDFGLARRLNEELHLTLTGAALGTPGYLPPEQISRRWGEVGPQSDIYALGALLYFLLTGRPPFLAESAVECLRQAEEAEPLNPIRLNPRIPPELAHICLACLEKEPRYRFPSASDLAADLRRFLKGEAIRTRTPNPWRRARRFLRRNRRITLAALGTVACVSILAGFAARALSLERMARKTAQEQAIRGDAVAQFLREIFDGLDPRQSDGHSIAPLLAALRKGVERLEQSYEPYPLVAAELREVFGVAYYRLGQYRESAAMHKAALKLQQSTPQADPLAIADSLYGLGVALWQLNQLPEAQKHLEECLQIRRRILGEGARATTYARNNLAAVLFRQGRLPEAATLARQNLDATREAFGAESCQTAGALSSLGVILARQGLRDEGEARQREAVALEERVHGSNHVDVGRALTALAFLERGSGRFREAEAHARRAVDILARVAPQHPDHADALSEWAESLIALGRFAEAEAPLSAALKLRTQTFQEPHPSISSLKSALEKVRQISPIPASPTNAIQTPP